MVGFRRHVSMQQTKKAQSCRNVVRLIWFLTTIVWLSPTLTASNPPSEDVLVQTAPPTDGFFWANCTPPAIEQFPRPLMSHDRRLHGGIIVHLLVCVYMFFALAIVCDVYFVPSLEKISEGLNLQPDVAGATFMAAGSSAPELATSVIGVFIAKDDIGLGTVVGSAVFNIMFVIAVCGLGTKTVLHLSWWPLFRDCGFYILSVVALLIVIYDEKVDWYEAVAFLVLYVIYCLFMYINPSMERWANSLKCPCSRPPPEQERTHLVTHTKLEEAFADDLDHDRSNNSLEIRTPDDSSGKLEDIDSLFERPDGLWKQIYWLLVLPLNGAMYLTVPDCRKLRWRSWFLVTFIMSLAWLAAYSYILVWMITIIGHTWSIPDTVMGLTFLAAGVSIPDAIASLIVCRDGQGDMAVSNAVGSNVFDILLCLGFPWFLQTVVVKPLSSVQVISKGLTYSTISLLSTVFFLIFSVHLNNWKLDRRLGIVLLVWYVFFMVLASLYELNVFGYFNPPACRSDY